MRPLHGKFINFGFMRNILRFQIESRDAYQKETDRRKGRSVLRISRYYGRINPPPEDFPSVRNPGPFSARPSSAYGAGGWRA